MKDIHWENLIRLINGESMTEVPVGFIIDSPWLPGWSGARVIDYFSDPETWFNSNLQAIKEFPEAMFLPGFWAEYGMCTEPSAFGAKLVWAENELPFPAKLGLIPENMSAIARPDVRTDGLLPLVINRMDRYRDGVLRSGCRYRFASSRGPLNTASFLFGTTDFMLALAIMPEEAQKALDTITDFIIDWIGLQLERYRDMDGIFILDDIAGFLGEEDYRTFVLPHLKNIYGTFNVRVKFFHNDASGLITAKYLEEAGINLFNFSFSHTLNEIRALAGNSVVLLGNLPPRDTLAMGSKADVAKGVSEMLNSCDDHSRVIWSCGGGMSPGTPTGNIKTFIRTVKERK